MALLFQFARYPLGYACRAWPEGSLCDDTHMPGRSSSGQELPAVESSRRITSASWSVIEKDDGVGAAEAGESIVPGVVRGSRDSGLHALKRHPRYVLKSTDRARD